MVSYFLSCKMKKSHREGPSGGMCPRAPVITKFTEYVGSFAVKEVDYKRRVWIIEEQMRFLKDQSRRRAVILKFCLQGVKMYDAEGETLLMAHALRRIQYTTSRPEDRQFAFVSRNPHRSANQLFCHLFVGSEAQGLNLLLCRSFQLQYLTLHPEALDTKALVYTPASVQRKSVGIMREPLNPEEVSQNVNALVSFRRLPMTGEVDGASNNKEASDGANVPRSLSLETPYCSPTLVRKKAIRSKVLRSGAYRCTNHKSQPQDRGQAQAAEKQSCIHTELSEKTEILLDAVWFCAGVDRDTSLTLLKEDRMGAFLLQTDLQCADDLTLFMSTQCGVIPYKIYRTPQAMYCFQHLPQEFPSLAALVDHHSGLDGSLFFQLAHGRVNPCYEAQESSETYPNNGPLKTQEAEQKRPQDVKPEERPHLVHSEPHRVSELVP
ncbi:SH2 domain-containing protein 5 [Mixophyes fleayi]|uniref:SH2 domain-containing protein 5 n=1 Tax=Mixophyes fleayi TaxID=3061075 RepID=UPI003F4E071B